MRALDWLLDSDRSIRWQVMRDLLVEPEEVGTSGDCTSAADVQAPVVFDRVG